MRKIYTNRHFSDTDFFNFYNDLHLFVWDAGLNEYRQLGINWLNDMRKLNRMTYKFNRQYAKLNVDDYFHESLDDLIKGILK